MGRAGKPGAALGELLSSFIESIADDESGCSEEERANLAFEEAL